MSYAACITHIACIDYCASVTCCRQSGYALLKDACHCFAMSSCLFYIDDHADLSNAARLGYNQATRCADDSSRHDGEGDADAVCSASTMVNRYVVNGTQAGSGCQEGNASCGPALARSAHQSCQDVHSRLLGRHSTVTQLPTVPSYHTALSWRQEIIAREYLILAAVPY